MKLIISHMSALRYWRASNEVQVAASKRKRCRVSSLTGSACSARDVKTINPRVSGFIMSKECPLDMLVPSREKRPRSLYLRPHMWSSRLPHGSLRRIDDDILICSPEFVYLQLAATLDVVELARIGNELCGSYSLSYGEGFSERIPLTSKKRLADFVNRSKELRGYRRAKRCLRWIADGSASPQETNILLAMCLPQKLGGYALPLPILNKEVRVGKRLSPYVKGNIYKPDYYWKVLRNGKWIKVTAEYDSEQEHNYGSKAEKTRIRRNDFKVMGYLVTSINKSQFASAAEFEIAVRQIARDLGLWRPESTITELFKHERLLDKLHTNEIR